VRRAGRGRPTPARRNPDGIHPASDQAIHDRGAQRQSSAPSFRVSSRALFVIKDPPDRATKYGEGKRGRFARARQRTNAPRRRHCSLRRYRSAGSRRPARRPPRNGGRGGGAVVDADAATEVATAEAARGRRRSNDAMAVPRGRDSAPPPTEGALDGATAPTTERRQPFRWCRRHPPRQRRKEIMCRPLSSSSYRRSPTADEGKALGLDRNDDLRTDNRRKASDATADDNNSSATSAARMS
jgi:hypothetical protein